MPAGSDLKAVQNQRVGIRLKPPALTGKVAARDLLSADIQAILFICCVDIDDEQHGDRRKRQKERRQGHNDTFFHFHFYQTSRKRLFL